MASVGRQALFTTKDVTKLRKKLKVGDVVRVVTRLQEDERGRLVIPIVEVRRVAAKYRYLVVLENRQNGEKPDTVTYVDILLGNISEG